MICFFIDGSFGLERWLGLFGLDTSIFEARIENWIADLYCSVTTGTFHRAYICTHACWNDKHSLGVSIGPVDELVAFVGFFWSLGELWVLSNACYL